MDNRTFFGCRSFFSDLLFGGTLCHLTFELGDDFCLLGMVKARRNDAPREQATLHYSARGCGVLFIVAKSERDCASFYDGCRLPLVGGGACLDSLVPKNREPAPCWHHILQCFGLLDYGARVYCPDISIFIG